MFELNADLNKRAWEAARGGTYSLSSFWNGLPLDVRLKFPQSTIDELKAAAADYDALPR